MKNRYKKKFIILLLFIFTISMSGCAGKWELEDLGTVRITGIDWDKQSEQYEITVDTLRFVQAGTAQMGARARQFSWVASAKGKSVMDAAKALRSRAPTKMSWLHSSVIIIGEDMALEGLDNFMDFFVRNREIRLTSYVFVTQGKAKDIIKLTPAVASTLSEEIEGLVRNNEREWGKTYIPTLKDFFQTLVYKDYDSVVGTIVPVTPVPFEHQTVKEVAGRESTKYAVALNGSAIIKNYKIKGWMDTVETRGYLWVANKVKMTTVDIADEKSKVSIHIDTIQTKVSPTIVNDNISMNIDIKVDGHITEMEGLKNYATEQGLKELEKKLVQKIKQETLSSIKKSQEFNADIFGFGREINKRKPDLWREVENNWNQIYPSLAVNINIDAKIKTIGLVSEPIAIGD